MEALKLCEANFLAYLHPSKSNNVKEAVYSELSSLLFQVDESLDGVVLAYKPKFDCTMGKILPGIHPYFGVKFQAKLLLFNPKPNTLLEGEVVKVCQQSIHIIVLGFSSAIISDDDIQEKFKYKIKHGKEVFVSKSHRRHKIKVGTIVRFSVKSFDDDILHICGSLTPSNTGCVRWLETNRDELPESAAKKTEIEPPVEKPEHDDIQTKKSKTKKIEKRGSEQAAEKKYDDNETNKSKKRKIGKS